MTARERPRIVVLSTLFPHPGQPLAGLFVRERMARVAEQLPLTVVAPVPWFPLQRLLRRRRPGFRPPAPREERQQGVRVLHPRFLSVPGLCKSLDGLFMALGALGTLRRLRRHEGVDLIDAHFGYPDGHAASLLARWLRLPFTVTLRGVEPRIGATRIRGTLMRRALARAAAVITVSTSLADWAESAGLRRDRIHTVGNGVDTERFFPLARAGARLELGLPADAPVLVTVGGLTERKGFHRVLDCLPALRARWPGLQYLVVGGASGEGDWRQRLEEQVDRLGLRDCVHFLGTIEPARLNGPLSAADVFVLATRNEGWANVLLEAMACGLPVVATDVGGNREVVADPRLGRVVPFGDANALADAIDRALAQDWDHAAIRAHAERNGWGARMESLVPLLEAAADGPAPERPTSRVEDAS